MTTVHSAHSIQVHNPADGTVVGAVPDQDRDAVAAAAAALRAAQPTWEEIGPAGRRKWLLSWQDWLIDNSARLSEIVRSETGKPRATADIEVPAAVDLMKYWANNAARFLADDHPKPHNLLGRTKQLTTCYRPYPVVGVITPWNFPLLNVFFDALPALMAGAAVLVKPSEVTPLSAVEIGRGWTEIGAPPVFSVVTGSGNTGHAVVEAVDYLQFTGSTRTGRKIAAACGDRLIPCSLELGGKDPAIVLADADLDRAANGIAYGSMFNAGQVCISIERVYVEEPVYDEFVAKLTERVAALRQGDDARPYSADVGALATPAQRDIVQRHVDEALAAGARTTVGGKSTGTGTFFEPTVLVDVDHSMSCVTEETFGPTVPVMKVADEDEAVRLANDSIYGLSATVWTGDKQRGEKVARRLEAGAVNVNDSFANMFSFALPMGGWKQSGIGARWGGAAGIRKYCRQQAITVPRLPMQKSEVTWFPASKIKTRALITLLQGMAARGKRRLPGPRS
ncbi:aldehyde dehydrogenase family protein [Nocardia goodfellowii]|uniref:Acyl-CoA reductase-like NAD-dependent aldehyde dehydrogenase n=1 Tax=Nocardia goodfellowii TaxID=882446 RepID=A0ABS4QIX7_9NOCA|nr:aldehyde dehydrogenase family protein [Nocardia goodfellowii]MBP2191662.1 acyl-CoA reductase-like NAD-dependent aldehyde dehydrogenase [Nocardia goodfellowii]